MKRNLVQFITFLKKEKSDKNLKKEEKELHTRRMDKLKILLNGFNRLLAHV